LEPITAFLSMYADESIPGFGWLEKYFSIISKNIVLGLSWNTYEQESSMMKESLADVGKITNDDLCSFSLIKFFEDYL